MNAVLIRSGIDQECGGWNAPVDAEGNFVYVPIPEESGTRFQPGLGRCYGEILPALHRFCREHSCDLRRDLRFPQDLLNHAMHLDPDFECLTYGNPSNVKGLTLGNLSEGDLVVFYAGLRPVQRGEHNLIYALIGMYVVQEVVSATSVPPERWYENAHVRKVQPGESDIVVRAKPGVSGRFDRCVSVGEWRDGAYRVRPKVLNAWGGLSVKDGFIQRSAVPPALNEPTQFLGWLQMQGVQLLPRNN
jgi:hypothetical protein